jgi:hypothetical protein
MSFEKVLLEAIDEGLFLLGESAKQVVYFYLEKNYKIRKQDIPYRIEDFTEAIETIFGVGAKLLEIKIMKNLFSKIGYNFPYRHTQEGLEFTKYIEAARIKGIRPFTLVTSSQL